MKLTQVKLTQEDVHRGSLILVNREHPCYSPWPEALTAVSAADATVVAAAGQEAVLSEEEIALQFRGEGYPQAMEQTAARALAELIARIGAEGFVAVVSGWRSFQEQKDIYDGSWEKNGQVFTESYVARPGFSEHQTGLAVDLGLRKAEIDFLCPEFPYEGICQKLREAAPCFGFVERYPAGKEAITGVAHEPWHFRYVGRPHAQIMVQRGLVLEEYHQLLKRYPWGCGPGLHAETGEELFYVACDGENGVEIALREGTHVQISGNNADGYIVVL